MHYMLVYILVAPLYEMSGRLERYTGEHVNQHHYYCLVTEPTKNLDDTPIRDRELNWQCLTDGATTSATATTLRVMNS